MGNDSAQGAWKGHKVHHLTYTPEATTEGLRGGNLVFALLGSHRAISMAELIAMLPGLKVNKRDLEAFVGAKLPEGQTALPVGEGALFFSSLKVSRIHNVFSRMGGVVKAGAVVGTQKWDTNRPGALAESLENILKPLADDLARSFKQDAKLNLAVSFLGLAKESRTLAQHVARFKGALKQALQDKGIKARLLGNSRDITVNTATTAKALRQGGQDLMIVFSKALGRVFVVRTFFVQDYKLWEKLDYHRPVRDMRVGMLPSKLARIMLNLARVKENKGVWDPFVGLGTTIMQGQLLGAYSYGSDINSEILQGADKNVQWLLNSGLVPKLQYRLFKFDVTKRPTTHKLLRSIIRTGRFDAIVTEGYLGAPRLKPFSSKKEAALQWRKVSVLYKALTKLQLPALRIEGRMVFTLPVYKYKHAGRFRWFEPRFLYNKNRLKSVRFNTGKLVWKNKDSIVARKIIVLERVK